MEAAACAKPATGYTYARREPEKTALFQVIQQHLTAPGDGEVTVVTDDTIGDKDPLLARLLAAATAGTPPAGPANKRKPIRIVLDPDDRPVAKGNSCGQHAGFNLHAATRVAVPRDFGTDSPPHPPLALRARPSPTTSLAV
jgi:hypothetical protein